MKIANWQPKRGSGGSYSGRAGEWAWRLVGQPDRRGPFTMEPGEAYGGLSENEAERIRIFGYKMGWAMAREKQEGGTFMVGRIPKDLPEVVDDPRMTGFARKLPLMFMGKRIGAVSPKSSLIGDDKLIVKVIEGRVELYREKEVEAMRAWGKLNNPAYAPAPAPGEEAVEQNIPPGIDVVRPAGPVARSAAPAPTHPDGTPMTADEIADLEAERSF